MDGRTQILPYQVVAGTKREASSSATASCTSTRGEGQHDVAHSTAARRDETHQLALAGRVVDLLEAHELGALEQLRIIEGAESASSRARRGVREPGRTFQKTNSTAKMTSVM